MFKKPGPATSTVEKSSIFLDRTFFIFSAISRGDFLFFFANTKAILEDKSKSKFSGGFSIIMLLDFLDNF